MTEPEGIAGVVSIPVRNCGEGAARLRGAALDCAGAGTYGLSARPSHLQWLPVGESERFFFDLEPGDATESSFGEFQKRSDSAVRVVYSDLAGNQWATRLDLQRDAGALWKVSGVFVTGEGRAPD